jgi:hypothetical protein
MRLLRFVQKFLPRNKAWFDFGGRQGMYDAVAAVLPGLPVQF